MTTGQPLLIQLPLSMANGQAGTLVNIPVSSLSAASSLNKAKTTSSTATFILKPASAITTAPASAPAAATVPALQASPGQMSVARAVYQGGTGGITTPNAGVSVTTARMPAQSVSVAGAISSVSSPATSGPAAMGSTAPGPPQGTSLTSKTGGFVHLFTKLLFLEVFKMSHLQSAVSKNQVGQSYKCQNGTVITFGGCGPGTNLHPSMCHLTYLRHCLCLGQRVVRC